MSNNVKSLDRLIGAFMMLPGVGYKTAQRYAYSILNASKQDVQNLSQALIEAKTNIKFCKICGNFSEDDECDICKSRKSKIICVVKEPKDVSALEKVREFNGSYHVLHGVINPLEGKGPNDINLMSLLDRVNKEGIKEVIVATNPDVEGEATAIYIANLLKPLGVKVTRLAQGVAMGSELEFTDPVTLSRAIQSRREM